MGSGTGGIPSGAESGSGSGFRGITSGSDPGCGSGSGAGLGSGFGIGGGDGVFRRRKRTFILIGCNSRIDRCCGAFLTVQERPDAFCPASLASVMARKSTPGGYKLARHQLGTCRYWRTND